MDDNQTDDIMKEKVLYGVKKDKPDYMEQLLSTKPKQFDKVKQLAKQNGFNRFRIAEIDMNKPLNFKGTIQ